MLRNLPVSVLALLLAVAACARHNRPVGLAPQTRVGPAADFGLGIVDVSPSDVDLRLDVPAYVVALRVTHELGVQVVAPVSGSPRSKPGTHYFRGGGAPETDTSLYRAVSSKPCTIRPDSRESCAAGVPMKYHITQLIQGGAPADAAGYWLLVVSDAPTPALDVMRRLRLMNLVDTSLAALVQSIPEPLIAARTNHWAAYYAAFGTPKDNP
jgi:hypothetical protein